jgi:hypothetical protein
MHRRIIVETRRSVLYCRLTALTMAALLFVLPGPCWSESQIFLKDGRVIKVDNFWREEGMVKYDTPSGIVGISLTDVEKIITPAMVAFDKARQADTIEAYEGFLRKFGATEFSEKARQRLKELQFKRVKEIDKASVYLDFIGRSPNSVFLQEARDRADVLVYEDAARRDDIKRYEEYLSLFPEGKYRASVVAVIENLKVASLKERRSIADIETFLKESPDSAFREELEEHLAVLQAEKEAATQKKLEQQKRTQQVAAERTQARRKRFVQISGSVAAVLLVFAVGWVLMRARLRRKASKRLIEELDEAMESEDERPELYDTFESGPVRYEDLVGVEKTAQRNALPGPGGEAKSRPGAPAALPAPERESDADETDGQEEFSPFVGEGVGDPEETVIHLGADEVLPAGDEIEEKVVDLSDDETDFKLELEDIDDGSADHPEPVGSIGENGEGDFEQGLDMDEVDFTELLTEDEEEIKRRRGGGEVRDA